MKKILIIEDDIAIRSELCELLANAGYETIKIEVFTDVKQAVLMSGADLILMDINLPGLNGEMLLRDIRKESDVPVIMVTSRVSEADEVLSMSYGADDYIMKPYNPTILLLRIAAIFKRMETGSGVLTYRDLQVNPSKGILSRGDRELCLTKNEMIIFQHLLLCKNRIVSRDELMTELWDHDEFINDNALTVNISRLRTKLSEFGYENIIETRKKQGYVLLQ